MYLYRKLCKYYQIIAPKKFFAPIAFFKKVCYNILNSVFLIGGVIMEFGAIQLIGGIIMLICSVLLIIITMAQEQKQQDMSSAITGQTDNFFGKGNVSSSREQALARLTKLLAVIFFVVTIAVNIIPAIIERVSNS